jgi:hypothetical protein
MCETPIGDCDHLAGLRRTFLVVDSEDRRTRNDLETLLLKRVEMIRAHQSPGPDLTRISIRVSSPPVSSAIAKKVIRAPVCGLKNLLPRSLSPEITIAEVSLATDAPRR